MASTLFVLLPSSCFAYDRISTLSDDSGVPRAPLPTDVAMTFFSTALAFVVTLGLLIVFHEFGHYLMARWCGVKVLRFSIGFGQPLLSKRWGKDQTEWVIAAFPLGGYVKMLDEREGSVAPQELPQSFNRKPVAHRFAIVAAGPVANFLLAILLYWLLFMLGVAAIKPVIGTVPPATPAAFAGFERGETITKIGGEPVTTWQDARWLLLSHVVDQIVFRNGGNR